MLKEIDTLASAAGKTRSESIREACAAWVKRQQRER
jgi:hypothetical protein